MNSCNQCHFSQQEAVKDDGIQDPGESAAISYRDIISLEAHDRITVSVPDVDLSPNQPFTQRLTFNGNRILYAYGYSKNGGHLQIQEVRWIQDSVSNVYSVKHDGISLPLLSDPGDYIFVLKLLHNRKVDFQNRSRWEEVVLIWTLSVSEETDG
jgi:hypothetical protein